jgi:hypothetical protein
MLMLRDTDEAYIRICEAEWKDQLYVVEQKPALGAAGWFDVQEYQYEPTRFRALVKYARLTAITYFLNEVLMRIHYEDKTWELRRRKDALTV